MRTRLRYVTVTVVLVLTLGNVVGPAFAHGEQAVTNRYTQSEPTNCLSSAKASSVSELGPGEITGTVRQVSRNLVEISYNGSTTTEFSLRIPQGMTIVASEGFRTRDDTIVLGGPAGPTWNASSKEHWIRYRTSDLFPNGSGWQLAPVPGHGNENVTLQPAEEGYIGPHVLYLGPYSKRSVTAGCQTITAIVPKRAGPLLNINRRLSDLQFAAQSLRTGHTYDTVRVFVSPARFEGEEVFGYNRRDTSTIVIQDYSPVMPSSIAWLHEYIHTRQNIQPQPSATWTKEASATYLAVRLAVERRTINPRHHDAWLAAGQGWNNSSTLTKAKPSAGVTCYRGAALLSQVERASWQANKTTVGDLLRFLNRHPNPGQSDIEEFLRKKGKVSPSQTKNFHIQVTTTTSIEPAYLLGPDWLTKWTRLTIGAIGSRHGGPWVFFMAGVVMLAEFLNRTEYDERFEQWFRNLIR